MKFTKIKKIIALGLAAMAAVSAMSVSAFASELISTEYVDGCEVQYMDDCTIVKATIEPSEISEDIVPYKAMTLSDEGDFVWNDITTTQTSAYTRSFTCNKSYGNRLNVYVNNTGSHDVLATLTLPAGSKLEETVRVSEEGVYAGYTFRVISGSSSTGLTGTHTLKITNTDTNGNAYTVTTRGRQYWD